MPETKQPILEPMLTPAELSAMTGICISTLGIYRKRNQGPVFCKLGKFVRYPESKIREWINAQANEQRIAKPKENTRKKIEK